MLFSRTIDVGIEPTLLRCVPCLLSFAPWREVLGSHHPCTVFKQTDSLFHTEKRRYPRLLGLFVRNLLLLFVCIMNSIPPSLVFLGLFYTFLIQQQLFFSCQFAINHSGSQCFLCFNYMSLPFQNHFWLVFLPLPPLLLCILFMTWKKNMYYNLERPLRKETRCSQTHLQGPTILYTVSDDPEWLPPCAKQHTNKLLEDRERTISTCFQSSLCALSIHVQHRQITLYILQFDPESALCIVLHHTF